MKLKIPEFKYICLMENFDSLPDISGTYAFIRKNKLLYVGQSKNIHRRINERSFKDWKITNKTSKLKPSDQILIWSINDHIFREDLEQSLILVFSPIYNTIIRNLNFLFNSEILKKSGFNNYDIEILRRKHIRKSYPLRNFQDED